MVIISCYFNSSVFFFFFFFFRSLNVLQSILLCSIHLELFISVKKTMRTQVNEMITKPGKVMSERIMISCQHLIWLFQ